MADEKNAEQINTLEKSLKEAFQEGRFDEAKKMAGDLKALDAENHVAERILGKLSEGEVSALEEKMNDAFKGGNMAEVEATMGQIRVLDPENKKAKKMEEEMSSAKDAGSKESKEKEGLFSKMFKKKGEPVGAVPAAAMHGAAPEKEANTDLKLEANAAPAKSSEQAKKGNMFTNLFGKKEDLEKPQDSIIDKIVEEKDKPKAKPAAKKEEKKEQGTGEGFRKFGKAFLQFSVVFIAISALFFYADNIDIENRVFSKVGIQENKASRLHAANLELEEKKAEEEALNQEIEFFQGGYQDANLDIVNNIVDNRLSWQVLIDRINEVTETVYETNELSQYVTYESYSYEVDSGKLSLRGALTDPLDKNLTKLAELEEAFRFYPRDPSDPNDETRAYFFGLKDFNTFAKTLDDDTGRFNSNLALSLFIKAPSAPRELSLPAAAPEVQPPAAADPQDPNAGGNL